MFDDTNWQAQCEAEPLAYSGAIQPHGALLRLDKQLHVTHASENVDQFLPYVVSELIGKPLPAAFLECVEDKLASLPDTPGSYRSHIACVSGDTQTYDVSLVREEGGIILEIFPSMGLEVAPPFTMQPVATPANESELQNLHEHMAHLFFDLTDFDRVMIYAFREDGDGEVLAEARREEVYGSYLGLRFPGSDIPHIARELYKKNPWRMIPDSQAASVAIRGTADTTVDLTWSHLRSVSPVHQIYLGHMQVGASLSFPILVSGELWGLVACHHATPKNLPLQVLQNAATVASGYSQALAMWLAESRMRFVDNLDRHFEKVRLTVLRHGDLSMAAPELLAELQPRFAICGLAICQGDTWTHCGTTPMIEALDSLQDWFETECNELLCTSNSLVRTHVSLGFQPVAGFMGLRVRGQTNDGGLTLWMFRHEQLHEVEWGGNPNKPVERYDSQIAISPRRSFEKWVEKRMGYSLPWTNEDRLAALRLRSLLLE